MKTNRPDTLQALALDPRRAAPMLMPALLGAVLLTDVTQVCARVRYPPAPAFDSPAPPARPVQNSAPSGRWVVLTGIIAYTDPRQGFVMIGNSVQNTFLARPGDQLPDGAKIHEIHLKNVVLEYGGSLETVDMYEHEQRPTTRAVYTPVMPPPPPKQAWWDEAELKEATTPTPSQPPRSTGSAEPPPSEQRPTNTRPGEGPTNRPRSYDELLSDPPPGEVSSQQAQPQDPSSPATQDPADEFGVDRRQRAESRRK